MDRIDFTWRSLGGALPRPERSAPREARPRSAAASSGRRIQAGSPATGGMPLTNARLTEAQLRDFCVIDRESRGLLEMAVDKLGMSARAHQRILKVARTIADLEGCDTLSPSHVAEAIQYRTLDRTLV